MPEFMPEANVAVAKAARYLNASNLGKTVRFRRTIIVPGGVLILYDLLTPGRRGDDPIPGYIQHRAKFEPYAPVEDDYGATVNGGWDMITATSMHEEESE